MWDMKAGQAELVDKLGEKLTTFIESSSEWPEMWHVCGMCSTKWQVDRLGL